MDNYKLVLILLAGGSGKRINRTISKQMIAYDKKTILETNIINFKKNLKNIPIQIVTNNQDFLKVYDLCKKYDLLPPVLGGDERFNSTYNGLVAITNINPKYVLIHDTARPLVSNEVIKNLTNYCKKEVFCVVPVLKLTDSIRTIANNTIKNTI